MSPDGCGVAFRFAGAVGSAGSGRTLTVLLGRLSAPEVAVTLNSYVSPLVRYRATRVQHVVTGSGSCCHGPFSVASRWYIQYQMSPGTWSQVSVACPSPGLARRFVGAGGASNVAVARAGLDGRPSPARLL